LLDLGAFVKEDDLASEHYLVLGMGVYPFGHYYLSPEGNFGGENDSGLIQMYQKYQFSYELLGRGAEASHLGLELWFLSTLKNNPEERRAFLAGHLLPWIPTFTYAIREVGSPLFSWLANYTFKILLEDWKNLGGEKVENLSEQKIVLPHWDVMKDFLDLLETGIRDIAQNLTIPAFSGFFLSKSSLKFLARDVNIPMGFGERANLLENLLRESTRYEEAGSFIKNLLAYTQKWKNYYHSLPDSLSKIKKEWLRVLNYTEALLQKIQVEVKK